jgi:GNAT superfamily N-acetyltransferase
LVSEYSPQPVDEAQIRRAWSAPDLDPTLDVRLDANGYALLESLGDGRVWLELHGRPSEALLDWAEARAGEKGRRLFSGAWAPNEPVLRELAARALRLVRRAHHMEIDLSGPTPIASWPSGIEVRTFRPDDERTFHAVQQETFEDSWEPVRMPFDEWSERLLTPPVFEPELWFLALAGAEPAGLAMCHPHPVAELGWISILGVRRPWRRRGLGRALLLHAFSEFRQHGFSTGGLGVDSESPTGANVLYDQVGMRVAARFDVYEKALG